jgi:hypothetical protein
MNRFEWSANEKRIARRAFDAAAVSLLDKVIDEFKIKAAGVATPEGMWALEDHLRRKRREVEDLLDYRYSVLMEVFARLICAGHMSEPDLNGLSEDKLANIRRLASWLSRAAQGRG